jgi:hypothetical protein
MKTLIEDLRDSDGLKEDDSLLHDEIEMDGEVEQIESFAARWPFKRNSNS